MGIYHGVLRCARLLGAELKRSDGDDAGDGAGEEEDGLRSFERDGDRFGPGVNVLSSGEDEGASRRVMPGSVDALFLEITELQSRGAPLEGTLSPAESERQGWAKLLKLDTDWFGLSASLGYSLFPAAISPVLIRLGGRRPPFGNVHLSIGVLLGLIPGHLLVLYIAQQVLVYRSERIATQYGLDPAAVRLR